MKYPWSMAAKRSLTCQSQRLPGGLDLGHMWNGIHKPNSWRAGYNRRCVLFGHDADARAKHRSDCMLRSRPSLRNKVAHYDSNGNEAQREAALKALAERIDTLVKCKSVVQLEWTA